MVKRIARWVFSVAAAMVTLYALVVVAGWNLPRTLSATSGIVINRPPESVWWILTDYNNAALWQPQYKESVVLSVPGEKPTRWRVIYTDGYVANIEVVEETFPRHLVERITDKDLPFGGTWTVDIAPVDGSSSRVTIQAWGEVYNAFDRVMVHFFVRPSTEMDRILKALKARVESASAS